MKIQKRIVSFLLSFVMLTGLTGMWCIPASADSSPEYYAFDVSSISTSANGFTNKGTVGDSSGKYVRFSPSEEMIYDPGQHYIKLDISQEVPAKTYSYVAIGYRTNIQTADVKGVSATSISAGLRLNGKETRCWGLYPGITGDGQPNKIVSAFEDITASQAQTPVTFDEIDDDTPVSFIRIGVYGTLRKSITMKTDDYIDIQYIAFFKTEEAANSFSFESAKSSKMYGDVNGDGVVNSLDSVMIARYLASWSGYEALTKPLNADLDADGSISALDSVVLARNLANWKGYAVMPYLHSYDSYINYREELSNSYTKIKKEGKLNVAYLGGSITLGRNFENSCWRTFIDAWFREEYPYAEIKMINAGIGGTGSSYGLYRLKQDVLDHDPDLVFIEFAVNDNHGTSNYGDYINTIESIQENYESIIRNIYAYDPEIDIVMVYTASRNMNRDTFSIVAQEKLARHYNINSIYFGQSLLDFLPDDYATNDEVWKKYFGSDPSASVDIYHPNREGYLELFKPLREFFVNAWGSASASGTSAKTLPADTVSDKIHNNPIMINGKDITERDAAWTVSSPRIKATSAGASFTCEFEGNAVALFAALSSKGGVIDYKIDDGVWKEKTLRGPTIKEKVPLETGLSDGAHTITVKVSDKIVSGETVDIYALLIN